MVHQASMEYGERWILNDVGGKSLYAWNSHGHQFRAIYDQLQRPVDSYFRGSSGMELLVSQSLHGEEEPDSKIDNHQGKVVRVFDQAGVVKNSEYDFKGNLLSGQRQFAQEYKVILDLSATVPLEIPAYSGRTAYDALNRPLELTMPDNSIIRTTYNEASLPKTHRS
jgi:YD repeat-containing protein